MDKCGRGSCWEQKQLQLYCPDPLFDTATAGGTVGEYDYLMGGYWQNMEDKESGMANWEATNNGLQDEFDSIVACQQLSMDGYPIVMPAI